MQTQIKKSVLSLFLLFMTSNFSLSSTLNPFIESTTPSMNAVSVNKSSHISVAFAQDMNAATINTSTIKVFGKQTGLLLTSVIYDPGTKTATIKPTNDFKTGEKISVSLTPGIETSENTPIASYVIMFTVETAPSDGVFLESVVQLPSTPSSAYISDLDGDFDLDLIVTISNKTFICKNNGAAVFSVFDSIPVSGALNIADFDSDFDNDIFIKSGNTYLFVNDGKGHFTQEQVSNLGTGAVGDLDGDGDIDLVYKSGRLDASIVKNSNASLQLDTTIAMPDLNLSNVNAYFSISDLNNDGNLDIFESTINYQFHILSYPVSKRYHKIMNDGQGKFSNSEISQYSYITSGGLPFYQYFNTPVDCDNDGDIDILTADFKFTNDGSGTFSRNALPASTNEIISGDFNGDEDMDIIGHHFTIYHSSLFNNDGGGNFTRSPYDNDLYYTKDAGDLDNDGDLDLISIIITPSPARLVVLLNTQLKTLNLTSFIEGFYRTSSHSMVAGDSLTVYLRNTSSPYAIADSAKGYLNTSGSGTFSFRNAANGVNYYLHLKHRNSIGTWSSTEISFVNSIATYDFSSSSSQAYGNNMIQVDNSPVKYALYSGDVNQDGIIDGGDLSRVDNDVLNHVTGRVSTDLTGDSIVDASDLSVLDKNVANGVIVRDPITGNLPDHIVLEDQKVEDNTNKENNSSLKFELHGNFPNPFNPETTINFEVPSAGMVKLEVFDILGKRMDILLNEVRHQGLHTVKFNAENLSSGIYLYKLTAKDFSATKRMIVQK